MENPYQAPGSHTISEDERIIDLLMRFQRQLKVVNMLRGEGMTYNDATNIVNENVAEAQRRLDKKHIPWRITGIFLLLVSMSALAACIVFGIIGFVPVGIICATLYASVVSFQRCEKIKP